MCQYSSADTDWDSVVRWRTARSMIAGPTDVTSRPMRSLRKSKNRWSLLIAAPQAAPGSGAVTEKAAHAPDHPASRQLAPIAVIPERLRVPGPDTAPDDCRGRRAESPLDRNATYRWPAPESARAIVPRHCRRDGN